MTLWEVDIYPAEGEVDRAGRQIAADAADMGLASDLQVTAARGYLIQGELDRSQVERLAAELLADEVVEQTLIAPVGDEVLWGCEQGDTHLIHVLPKPGVMDPVAQSAQNAIADFDMPPTVVRTFRKYWLSNLGESNPEQLSTKLLANDSIEQVVAGPLRLDRIDIGANYEFELLTVNIRELDDDALMQLSREGQLYLTLVEMQTIKQYYVELGRDPTDAELETIAQTWSEHCSHKTLAGRIAYRDEHGEKQFENMLKETIFAATQTIRAELGDDDWCVSVFQDNAGVIRFEDEWNVVFKVETHNHPSALEPYGGANTGLGGVIRDPLGTGMGAKPICNTDVFCFAPPDTPADQLPPGVLHPRRVMKGVVSGVRDYGNRMGIPTVNGAVYFDPRYLGNPLVYCGNVGLLPHDKSFGDAKAGDYIVAVGGRTGRDGIHGATFSSAELTSESESLSGGAVQIGNAITEKMVTDCVLKARDLNLYTAITDCGAGGFSSAVGEMGEKIGAVVDLDKCPLKYDGLSYTEIWISEAQERMVLSVPPEKWDELRELFASESVEATVIGEFVETGRLQLRYHGEQVADLTMEFLHDGRPPIVREAVFEPMPVEPLAPAVHDAASVVADTDGNANNYDAGSVVYVETLKKILGSLNVASKEWVIRQYDHEVQAGSVIKPLVGIANDGPGDAAVIRPLLKSDRGLAVSCGMNPHFGDFDPYHMAASAIDEAIRNCVAVGADPSRIAILDNFCWGYTDRPETLGTLVRAALACQEMAVALGTPFISGKDSLNNEFSYLDESGEKKTIAIPSTLLISAIGIVNDVNQCVTMDFKQPGNLIYLVGATRNEMGGSHYALVEGLTGGSVPEVNAKIAKQTFTAMHEAITAGHVRACHDLSEGGLAVALAEMAFAGGIGARVELDLMQCEESEAHIRLFSESNTRFLCEVAADQQKDFERLFPSEVPLNLIGQTIEDTKLLVTDTIEADLAELKEAWQAPLRW